MSTGADVLCGAIRWATAALHNCFSSEALFGSALTALETDLHLPLKCRLLSGEVSSPTQACFKFLRCTELRLKSSE